MALRLQASSRDHHAAEIWTSDSDSDLELTAVASSSSSSSSSCTTSVSASPPPTPPPAAAARLLRQRTTRTRNRRSRKKSSAIAEAPVPEPEAEDVWRGAQWEAAWPARRDPKPVVLAAGGDGDDAVGRSRSLTDDDLEELKGCADLGFGFSYDEIPELRGTLPALELCYSMTQRLQLDDVDKDRPPPQQQEDAADAAAAAPDVSAIAPSVTNWKISSPGDSPDEVKARLKYWAQAVACTVRLCS